MLDARALLVQAPARHEDPRAIFLALDHRAPTPPERASKDLREREVIVEESKGHHLFVAERSDNTDQNTPNAEIGACGSRATHQSVHHIVGGTGIQSVP